MINFSAEQRQRERRSSLRGGRRFTDVPGDLSSVPSCPACEGNAAASEVGEAEGGWWFVCRTCDHLWNERERPGRQRSAEAGAGSAEKRGLLSWATVTVVRQMLHRRAKR
jgi:rubredoxin